MGFTPLAMAISVALFFGMLGLEVYGFRRGRARPCGTPEGSRHGLGSVEAV